MINNQKKKIKKNMDFIYLLASRKKDVKRNKIKIKSEIQLDF